MNESLPVLVSLVGLTVAGIGLIGVVAPTKLSAFLDSQRVLTGLPVTIAVRIVTGSIFLIAAQGCRLPTLVCLIGLLEFGGAAILVVLRGRPLARFVEWWLQRSASFIRYWCLGALTLGTILVYAGA
jgi:hypothetical protein